MALLWPTPTLAGDYLAELVAAARAQKLADHPQWHALLHYRSRPLFPGLESFADDASFFNAPDGKTNAQHELEATLTVFFSAEAETPTSQNPQCRFIARYHWLDEKLHFDPARLARQPCRRFQEWRAALDPAALTLVFPAAYLNNPASLYGHTLLRVDGRDQDERTRLLAYTINYAAATDESSGLIFAVRGIFGGYAGLFSMSPYYAKVTEYNDLENRDIWEYELNFTQAEIERLLMHAWELGPIRFDYYFFDENCSYHLLSLFDAARPELRLTDQFPLWVIPADTVRAVAQTPGLLRRTTYRPATSTILRYRMSRMSADQIQRAKAVALGQAAFDQSAFADTSETDRARILELAYDFLEYERLRGRTPDRAATAERLRGLLLARSRLDVADVTPPPVPAVRPDEGHWSARMSVRLGRESGDAFTELQLRPAYHDLLDPEDGYNRGAAIEFVDVRLRHRARDDETRIERVDFINITSLSPRDELLKPLSWTFDVGYVRKPFAPDDDPLVFRGQGGVGFTWDGASRWMRYALLEAALDVSGHLEDGYAVGAGVALGSLFDVSHAWRVQLEARARRYAQGPAHSATEVVLGQRFTLTPSQALRLELSRREEFSQLQREVALSWHVYF